MPQEQSIDDIQILRAWAILLVTIAHFQGYLIYWSSPFLKAFYYYFGGAFGVDLFFVISGFVIAKSLLPTLRKTNSTQEFFQDTMAFWIRRFWRLTPSAWLWIGLTLLLCLGFNDSGAFYTLEANLQMAAASLLKVANFYTRLVWGQPEYTNALSPYWSLSLEEQFYFLLPLLVFFFRRRLTFLLVLLVSIQPFLHHGFFVLGIMRSEALFLGVLIAIWQSHPTYKQWNPKFLQHAFPRILFTFFIIGSLILLNSKMKLLPPGYSFGPAALVSGAAVLAASYNQNYLVQTCWLKSVLLWIGSRSYGLYLIHIPAFAASREIFYRTNPNNPIHLQGDFAIAFFVIFGILFSAFLAELNYRLIEMPLRHKGKVLAHQYLDERTSEQSTSARKLPAYR
jgi:peptidoglycan/LPS O-acetylase OafA/YrhL